MRGRRTRIGAVVLAGAAVIAVVAFNSIGVATHTPANKVWVAASTVDTMQAQLAPGTTSREEIILAQGRAKYSNPTDVRLSVTAECALWTNTATTGDDDSESKARVEVWITIDGNVVPVSEIADPSHPNSTDPDSPADRGRVVFCNRAARMKTENIEAAQGQCLPNAMCTPDSDTEDDILIRSYNRTRDANGFNWAAMNVGEQYDEPFNGNNIVQIQVHARLAAEVTDSDTSDNNGVDSPAALAAVGKRTLFVEPVKMANDATF
jgi:hypothetical protein